MTCGFLICAVISRSAICNISYSTSFDFKNGLKCRTVYGHNQINERIEKFL